MRQLPNAYTVGKIKYVHAGYRVHKIIGRLNKPMEEVGKIYESPEAALGALEKLEDGYAVFRIVRSKNGDEPYERISKDDIPISIV